MALPSSGPLSLNDMHVEVNGTSGTTCSINDSDIRGLIDKADGATSSFNEFYGAANVSYISASGGSTTCLLYTSPSPRDRQKSRMPSSA